MLKAMTRGVVSLLLFVVTAHGQTPPAKGPTFEVAAISPAEPLDIVKAAQSGNLANLRLGANITDTRADLTYLSLTNLVQMAFKVQPFQMSAPSWMNEARFDIHATIPQGATREQVPDMLQALLVERFGMVARRESREVPVYSLTVNKDGPKLVEAAPEPAAPTEPGKDDVVIGQGENQIRMARGTGPNGANSATITTGRTTMQMSMSQDGRIQMNFSRLTMEELVALLTQMGDRPVVDNTGLKGAYQMKLELAIADLANVARAAGLGGALGGAGGAAPAAALPASAAADPSGSSMFEMVQRLGLKMEPKRAPIEFVVVDKIEKMPTPN